MPVFLSLCVCCYVIIIVVILVVVIIIVVVVYILFHTDSLSYNYHLCLLEESLTP